MTYQFMMDWMGVYDHNLSLVVTHIPSYSMLFQQLIHGQTLKFSTCSALLGPWPDSESFLILQLYCYATQNMRRAQAPHPMGHCPEP